VQILDLELWFHLLEQGRFAYIGQPLCAFRLHHDQQSAVHWRSGVGGKDNPLLAQEYYAKPWLREMATPKMLFTQIYYLNKHYGERAKPLTTEMKTALGGFGYSVFWLRHRVSKPLKDLKRWFDKPHPRPSPEIDWVKSGGQ